MLTGLRGMEIVRRESTSCEEVAENHDRCSSSLGCLRRCHSRSHSFLGQRSMTLLTWLVTDASSCRCYLLDDLRSSGSEAEINTSGRRPEIGSPLRYIEALMA